MEMWVERSQNSGQALGAADDKLRLLTVGKATALTPQTAFATRPVWTAAAPESVAPFSAACFYMVQALRQTSKVPIGAIHSSWGGSRISAWLARSEEHTSELQSLMRNSYAVFCLKKKNT